MRLFKRLRSFVRNCLRERARQVVGLIQPDCILCIRPAEEKTLYIDTVSAGEVSKNTEKLDKINR